MVKNLRLSLCIDNNGLVTCLKCFRLSLPCATSLPQNAQSLPIKIEVIRERKRLEQYTLVSHSQTSFLAQDVIACSISARTKKESGIVSQC